MGLIEEWAEDYDPKENYYRSKHPWEWDSKEDTVRFRGDMRCTDNMSRRWRKGDKSFDGCDDKESCQAH